MKRSVLLTSIVALSAFFSLTSCNNAGGDTTTPPVGGTTTPGGDDTPVEPFDGWADEDAAHVAQEYKGVANSGEEGINLSGISASEKASLLGDVEAWALKNHLLGIPLFGDGGWTLLSTRVQPALNEYLANYGFGISREGKITSDMTAEQEPNPEYRSYYHSPWNPSNADGKLNPFDANNSAASSLNANNLMGLYSSRLKKDGEGGYLNEWEWYPALAEDVPEPVDWDEETNTATTWRIKVRTTGVKYTTASTATVNGVDLSRFNGQEVSAKDYLYSYHLMLNGNNQYSYTPQYITDFVGASEYYEASASTPVGSDADNALFEKVGIKLVDDDTLEFHFTSTMTKNTVMMQLSSHGPTNEEFFKAVTGWGTDHYDPKAYGSNLVLDGKTYTPADTLLSCGPYTLTKYDVGTGSDMEIVYKRNDDWIERQLENNDKYEIYAIKGYVYKVNSAYEQSTTSVYNDYLAGKLDESSIPLDRRADWEGDKPGKYITGNYTITALQINSCTSDRWQEVFGPEGTNWEKQQDYTYDEATANDYTIKPVMSNSDFLDGLYFSINRQELADTLMYGASSDWIGEAYMMDIDSLVSYDATAAHARAVKDWSPDTLGYSTAIAQQKFESAMDQLTESGAYTPGTASDPTVIKISMQLASQSQIDNWGNRVKSYIEKAFNTTTMLNKGYKLEVELPAAPANGASECYTILASGCYDLCWGGISGGTADAFGMIGCYLDSWDNGLQMGVGTPTTTDTGKGGVIYDGYSYSLQGIFYAIEWGGPVIIENGVMVGIPEEDEPAEDSGEDDEVAGD